MEQSSMEMSITNNDHDRKAPDISMEEDTLEQNSPDLKKALAAALVKNETLTQQIFESKRSTACYKLMAEERNTLFSSLYKEKLELNSSKKKTVEVFRNDVINPLKMKLNVLQQEFYHKEENYSKRINIFKETMSELKLRNEFNEVTVVENDHMQLEAENEEYKLKILELRVVLETRLEELKAAEAKVSVFLDEILETKTQLHSTTHETASLKEKIEELNEDIAILGSQITMKKAQPQTDGTRGNSLFGEVDDRRLLMTKHLKKLKKAYEELKVTAATLNSAIKKLRCENIAMIENIKKSKIKREEDSSGASGIETFEAKVESAAIEKIPIELTTKIMELETECNKVEAEYEDSLLALNSKLPEEMFQQIDRYIFHLRNKQKKSREEVQKNSVRCFKLFEDLYANRLWLINVKLSLLLEEFKTENLSQQIQDYKCSETINTTQDNMEDAKDVSGADNTVKSSQLKSPAKTATKENVKPEKEKKKPSFKFVSCQRVIKFDDL